MGDCTLPRCTHLLCLKVIGDIFQKPYAFLNCFNTRLLYFKMIRYLIYPICHKPKNTHVYIPLGWMRSKYALGQ